MYKVTKSIAHGTNTVIAIRETLKEAVKVAREAGATGKPEQRHHDEWLFSGGSDRIGFWIHDDGK